MPDRIVGDQLRLIEKEIALLADALEEAKVEARAARDDLLVDIEAIRRVLTIEDERFPDRYRAVREAIVKSVDPEELE